MCADFLEKLPAVTVVQEGEEVVLNCTTTNPTVRSTFTLLTAEVSPPSEPGPNVWQFTADNALYSGFYSCTAEFESRLTQITFLVIFPDSCESFNEHSNAQFPHIPLLGELMKMNLPDFPLYL